MKGLSSLVDIETMSIMGFGNAILAYQRLSALADRLVDQVISARPKIVLTIDNKGIFYPLCNAVEAPDEGCWLVGSNYPLCCAYRVGVGRLAG